jgi:hypothetical protein
LDGRRNATVATAPVIRRTDLGQHRPFETTGSTRTSCRSRRRTTSRTSALLRLAIGAGSFRPLQEGRRDLRRAPPDYRDVLRSCRIDASGGDILIGRDPSATEQAYRESIRVAREQGAHTFELQAALPLFGSGKSCKLRRIEITPANLVGGEKSSTWRPAAGPPPEGHIMNPAAD